jgi:uncharacterized protein (TIGR02246 family)
MNGTTTETGAVDTIMATTAAWTRNDADEFAELYASDATVVLTGGTFLQGREELRRFMAAGFAGRLAGTFGIDEQDSVRVLGNTAIVVSRSGFKAPGPDAPSVVRRATWTLVRQDGRWLVASYHNCDI